MAFKTLCDLIFQSSIEINVLKPYHTLNKTRKPFKVYDALQGLGNLRGCEFVFLPRSAQSRYQQETYRIQSSKLSTSGSLNIK
jgi:hypothetical protein